VPLRSKIAITGSSVRCFADGTTVDCDHTGTL
jgi:hypothetical protein